MADELADSMRAIYDAATPAFNRGDFDLALGTLPEDVEWHAPREDADHGVYRGPEAIKHFFEEMRSVFDGWRVEVRQVEQPSDRTALVYHVIRGTSRGAEVPVEVHTYELWEFAELEPGSHRVWQEVGLRPARVRQFFSRDEALAAASG